MSYENEKEEFWAIKLFSVIFYSYYIYYQLGLALAATRPSNLAWNILEHAHLFMHSYF